MIGGHPVIIYYAPASKRPTIRVTASQWWHTNRLHTSAGRAYVTTDRRDQNRFYPPSPSCECGGMAEWTIAPALKAGGLWPPGFESQSHRVFARTTPASTACARHHCERVTRGRDSSREQLAASEFESQSHRVLLRAITASSCCGGWDSGSGSPGTDTSVNTATQRRRCRASGRSRSPRYRRWRQDRPREETRAGR